MSNRQALSKLGFDLSPLSTEDRKAREAKLDPETARIVLKQGTEPPFVDDFMIIWMRAFMSAFFAICPYLTLALNFIQKVAGPHSLPR